MSVSLLAGWDNFWVIAASAAAALTGLTFIVITLSAQNGRISVTGLRIFISPTIVHFAAVLGLSAYLSMPGHSQLSVGSCVGLAGAAGVAYVGSITASVARMTSRYVPVREDWIWNVIMPALAYLGLTAAGLSIWRWPHGAPYGVAAALILLMLIGIHNAWDIAVWNSIHREGLAPPKDR
jgi:hypothetical protein